MPSSESLDEGNVGDMVVNSSTDSVGVFEAGARSEEARIPLLDEEEKGSGSGSGRRVGETSRRNGGEGAEEDAGAGTRGFAEARERGSARRDETDAPLDQADIAYGSNSFMAVVKPVTLTMTLSAAITASLYTDAKGAENSAFAVYEVYDESSTLDPSTVRLGKSLVNAFLIVGVLAAATVVIVIMYWMRCMKCLLGYMAMSSVLLLGLLGGVMWKSALEVFQIPCDAFTFYGFLWNFAVVGVVAIFYQKGIPTVVTQAYLVATSIIMAWHLSRFEEWTGWCLLAVLALYDLCAVLTPCGPLKALLHLMEEYDEPMPGLLYEAELPAGPHERPPSRRNRNRRRRRLQQQQQHQDSPRPPPDGEEGQAAELMSPEEAQALIRDETAVVGDGNDDGRIADARYGGMLEEGETKERRSGPDGGKVTGSAERETVGAGETPAKIDDDSGGGYSGAGGGYSGTGGVGYSVDRLVSVESPGAVAGQQSLELVQPIGAAGVRALDRGSSSLETGFPSTTESAVGGDSDAPSSSSSSSSSRSSNSRGFLGDASALSSGGETGMGTDGVGDGGRERERAAVDVTRREDGVVTENGRVRSRRSRLPRRESADEGVENEGVSIKLGLGDFIFYSVLVTKAALYSFTAWATCVVVIVFGLGATLVLLAVYRMALPALPISIGLGTIFYLVTRLSMQPYVEALNEAPLYF